MSIFNRWCIAATLVAAATVANAMPISSVDVRLDTATPVLRGDVDVSVTVTVTNTQRHPVQLLKWQLPLEESEGALFRIKREDGSVVRYEGAMVKRTAPQAQDHVRLDPGASINYTVELSADYDLSRNGRYAIEYAGRGVAADKVKALWSEPLYLWLEGRSAKATTARQAAAAAPGAAPSAGGTAYSSCSATQQSALVAATDQAVTYASVAVNYLQGNGSATPRYTKWFGSYSSPGWATARAHFAAVHSAFTTQNLAYDCKCKKQNTYAYVYANQPYKIYLCGAFWAAPLAGTDSRGGTLIHEMTHFTVVAGTDDYAYGQTAAANLAATDSAKALDNADSHEYFAENTPVSP